MNAFNAHISIFEKFGSEPKPFTLDKWIKICRDGCRYSNQILKYRQTGDTQYKNSLPFVTVGAVCEGGRKSENVISRTGWIALDIDGKDNTHIQDSAALRDELEKIVYVAFAGLSASGKGVWCLVKVSNPNKQHLHFEQLKTDFESIGIKLDGSKGKNPHDARYYSYDPDAWTKEDFKVYNRLPVKRPKPSHAIKRTSYSNDTRSDVEQLIQQIQRQRVDITEGYEDWRDIGFALESEFGESGRDYFHAVSRFHTDYNERKTDQQYTHCLKSNGQGVTIASFFHTCKRYGLTVRNKSGVQPDRRTNTQKKEDKPSEGKFDVELNNKGYPKSWDDITLDESDLEYKAATRQALSDCDSDYERLKLIDPKLALIESMFDAVPENEVLMN